MKTRCNKIENEVIDLLRASAEKSDYTKALRRMAEAGFTFSMELGQKDTLVSWWNNKNRAILTTLMSNNCAKEIENEFRGFCRKQKIMELVDG